METEKNSKTIKTKLKFIKSEKTGCLVAFVTRDEETNYFKGVRCDSDKPKSICILSNELQAYVEPGVLYDVEMIPLENRKSGFKVIHAEPHGFHARISSTVVKNAIYKVVVQFGNRTIVFDPLDGKKESFKTIEGVVKVLESRKDILDLMNVIEDFRRVANVVLMHYETDGNYVPKKKR